MLTFGLCLYSLFYFILLYILWEKVIVFYYQYWHYYRQGVPTAGFPLPLVGNLIKMKRLIENSGEYSPPANLEYLDKYFGIEKSRCILDFRQNQFMLFINDPEMVQELYVQKNKYFDKHHISKIGLYSLIGDSLVFEKSNDLWQKKRKHLSAAFYKEKMNQMLLNMINMTFDKVQTWKADFSGKDKYFSITKEIQMFIMDCIQVCVFGMDNLRRTFELKNAEGKNVEYTPGNYMRESFLKLFYRQLWPSHILFPVLNYYFLTSPEKEMRRNDEAFKNFVRGIIKERKQQLKDANYQQKTDFLTILLNDEFYQNDEKLMIDECLTFMFASTQTTSSTIQNVLYYLTQHPEIRNKLRIEMQTIFPQHSKDLSKITKSEWQQLLNSDMIDKLHYTFQVVQETLRLEPPVPISMTTTVTQNVDVCGVQILKDQIITINMHQLHHNPQEWQEPNKFIPERFDPKSEFYLTPKGQKRHPMSFGPFLGGKRICLGKTFAENLLKCVVPIIVCNLEFEFDNPVYYERKPTNSLLKKEPPYNVKVK